MGYRILAIDGGGVRGMMPATWLKYIEEKVGKPIHECFDMYCGTSSGSIIAAAISSGKTAQEVHKEFRGTAKAAFPSLFWQLSGRMVRTFTQGLSAPKYSGRGLQQILIKQFGPMKFGELKKPTLITSFNLLHRKPLIFKSFHPYANERNLWEIVKCSSSAPTYFPAHILEMRGEMASFIDGAVVANNPAMIGIAEAIALGVSLDDIWVLSLGTGEVADPISNEQATTWGSLQWLPHIWNVTAEGGVEVADYESKKVLDKYRYNRIQRSLEANYAVMDDASSGNLNNLEQAAKSHVVDAQKQFEKVIEELSN